MALGKRIPVPIMAVRQLQGNELKLLAHYIHACDIAYDGACWEGHRRTAEATGINRETAYMVRRKLEEKGWIVVKEHERGTMEVSINDEKMAEADRYNDPYWPEKPASGAGVAGNSAPNIYNIHNTSYYSLQNNTSYYARYAGIIREATTPNIVIGALGDAMKEALEIAPNYARVGRLLNTVAGEVKKNHVPFELLQTAGLKILKQVNVLFERHARPNDVYSYIMSVLHDEKPTVEVSDWERENYG